MRTQIGYRNIKRVSVEKVVEIQIKSGVWLNSIVPVVVS